MKILSADYIFSAHTGFIRNGVLVLNDDGTVADLSDPAATRDLPAAQHYDGVLCPGFVNTHCHLELSHLRGQVTKHTGFAGFAKELLPKRGTFSAEQIAEAIVQAEDEMFRNGIVAVGDISNLADSFAQKAKGRLQYHTFIELLALNPAMAETVFKAGKALLEKCPQPASLAPHAPYTVSRELVRRIAEDCLHRNVITTLHNQESLSEQEFSEKGTGPMQDFYRFLGIDLSFYRAPGENSLRATLPGFLPANRVLLVHNTFTSAEDLAWAGAHFPHLSWCFCPNANLYIENTLPDFEQFHRAGVHITVGTDSLASNDQLSILEELKIITRRAPSIPVETLLTWATRNGAQTLGFPALGTFEKGKKPGVVRLKNITPGAIAAEATAERVA